MIKYLKIWCALLNKRCDGLDEKKPAKREDPKEMIQALIGSIGSLASSYLEGKTAIQKAEATIRMKEATERLIGILQQCGHHSPRGRT